MLLTHQVYKRGMATLVSADFVWAGNGIFRHGRRTEFTATVLYCPVLTPGLDKLSPSFSLLVPLVPERLVRMMLNEIEYMPSFERLFYLYWQESKWALHHPKQRASTTNCHSIETHPVPASIEVHSHGNHRAFFSETDNLEEDGFRLSIIIGRDKGQLEVAARVCLHGSFYPIDSRSVLENIGEYCHVI